MAIRGIRLPSRVAGMITGGALSTFYYNLKLRHPTLNMPIIDYDLALLIQPMLILGISIGVIFNVVFPDWLVTILLIVLFVVTSTKAFSKCVETWKKETIIIKGAARRLEANGSGAEVEYRPLPSGLNGDSEKDSKGKEVTILENVYWKEFGLLVFVWVSFLAIQIAKQKYTSTCSTAYWVLNLLQVSSATATFAMTFSASMSVIEYYLLKRFPVPYALYFTLVANGAALVGQHVVRKLIILFGRASLIIFVLASPIFVELAFQI